MGRGTPLATHSSWNEPPCCTCCVIGGGYVIRGIEQPNSSANASGQVASPLQCNARAIQKCSCDKTLLTPLLLMLLMLFSLLLLSLSEQSNSSTRQGESEVEKTKVDLVIMVNINKNIFLHEYMNILNQN